MNKSLSNAVILGGTGMIDTKCENIENYIWKNREKCRLCDSTEINIFFNLNPTPQANHFVNKPIIQEHQQVKQW